MQYKKAKRQEDKDYKKYIESQPCIVGLDCIGDICAHHVKSRGTFGSDYCCVPLCVKHHIPGIHTLGIKTFQERFHIDLDKEVIRLLIGYINSIKEGL